MALEPLLELVVRDVRPEAEGVITLVLASADQSRLPGWDPGAHLALDLPMGARQYSLSGDPDDLTTYEVAVQNAPDGRGGSRYVHERLTPGTSIRVRPPRNNFPLVQAPRYVFIAGGIGITPLLPMIQRVERLGGSWHLFYGGRSLTTMAFLDRLRVWSGHVTVVPQDRDGLLPLAAIVEEAHGAVVYCCGPEPLLAAVEELSADKGVADLHVERFEASGDRSPTDADTSFDVTCRASGITVHVPADRTMLDAMLEAGLDIESDCEEGICGTCEVALLAGDPDHRDDILTDEERRRLILPCVSRALGERLVVDA